MHPVGAGVACVPDVVVTVQIVGIRCGGRIEIDVCAARRVGLSGDEIHVYLLVLARRVQRLVRLDKLLIVRIIEVGNGKIDGKACRYAHSALVFNLVKHIVSDKDVVYEKPILRSVAHDAETNGGTGRTVFPYPQSLR